MRDSHGLEHTPGDPGVARTAERQHGVVSDAQLRAARVERGGGRVPAQTRPAASRDRGVYAVGHARLTWRGRLWAAVLATGGPEKAAISHRAAADVWQIVPFTAGGGAAPSPLPSHKTTALNVHRSRRLDAAAHPDDGLPLTTV